MRVRTWGLLSILGLAVAAVVVVLVLSSDPDPAEARVAGPGSRTITEDGVRWRFDGRAIVVTVTSDASAKTRRRLKGPLVVGCSRAPTLGSPGKASTGIARTRIAKTPGSLRARLTPRITRADICFIERRGDGEDVVSVRFPADAYPSTSGGDPPSDADRAAIVATLVQRFEAESAKDRPRECATYTENAARAVAAQARRFLLRPTKAEDCVGVLRASDRQVPEDAIGTLPDPDVQKALKAPEKLDLKVKDGRARVSNSGTQLDYGFELIRVGNRWLIDRLPA